MKFGFFGKTPTTSLSSAVIRHKQRRKEDRRTELSAARQALAHDELQGDSAAAARRADLERQISTLDREIRTLSEALPTAVAHEQLALRDERDRLAAELRRAFTEREQARKAMLDDLIAKPLPTVDEMVELRVLSKECSELAYAIEAATGEQVPTIDALQSLRSTLHERHEEFERRFLRTLPRERPDFTNRSWRPVVDALRALRQQEQEVAS